MSFGGPRIDELCTTGRHPTVSMITGLLANALGWERHQWWHLEALQRRLILASRLDRPGELLADYQSVELSLVAGHPDHGTERSIHLRQRQYLADAVVTIAIGLRDGADPDLVDCELALRFPARPLALGRAACLPSQPLVRGHLEAATPEAALATWPRHARSDDGALELLVRDDGPLVLAGDRRDWANGIGVGSTSARRLQVVPPAPLPPPEVAHA